VPFDPRLIATVPPAVAKAAMESGVARKRIENLDEYARGLAARFDRTGTALQGLFDRVRDKPRRVVFTEGEEERVIRAAMAFRAAGFGTPVLVGREERVQETIRAAGLVGAEDLEITNAKIARNNKRYTDYLFGRLQRQGFMYRDCQRMVNQDRNVFGGCMVALGDADAMVTGVTRTYTTTLEEVRRAIDVRPGERLFGLTLVLMRGQTLFISDTTVHELPSPETLADIAVQTAARARSMGHEPRVAMLSFSNFGNPMAEKAERVRDAVKLLDGRKLYFEYDGEMSAEVALDHDLMKQLYPFCRLSGPANVLVMPALHSASIASQLLAKLGGGVVIGPLLMGLDKPVQIVPMGASVSDIVTMAAIAASEVRS
jgi:malate dehydrogenase (oxaloacetate-decarboxylating)(NADP+)